MFLAAGVGAARYDGGMTNLVSGITLAEVASVIGDVARANILSALMDGRALTAGELAWHAGVGAPTTSGHLAKLTEANLVSVEKQGRHRYYRLASAQVAEGLEALMNLSLLGPRRHRPTGPKDQAMRTARTCYDHLAGRLGIAVADAMSERGFIILGEGAGTVTEAGRGFLQAFGVDPGAGPKNRPVCKTCLDWSERRPHLAGKVGVGLCNRAFELGWIERTRDSRALKITAAGQMGFAEAFGFTLDA